MLSFLKYFTIIIYLLFSTYLSAQMRGNNSYGFSFELNQPIYSFKNIYISSETNQGLVTGVLFKPSLRFGLIKQKDDRIKHSLTVGYANYSMFYSQEAIDYFYYYYPLQIDKKKVYYDRYFNIINISIGYNYYFNITKKLCLYLGVDYSIPLSFYSNNEGNELVVGYSFKGNGVNIDTRHEEYQVNDLEERVLDNFSLLAGIDYSINASFRFGIGTIYKISGSLLASDKLYVIYEDNEKSFFYKQNVYLSNKYLNINVKFVYILPLL